jgi:hypothetical protein
MSVSFSSSSGVGVIHSSKTISAAAAADFSRFSRIELELRLGEKDAELQRKNVVESKLHDDLLVEKIKVQTLRDEVTRKEKSAKDAELELAIMCSIVERLENEIEGVTQKVDEIKSQLRAQMDAEAIKKATLLSALQPITQVTEEFKLLYGNGSDDVRIEYCDGFRLLLIVVSAGLTFVHWSANSDKDKPQRKRYIQFADATLAHRIELPLFFWGKRGEVSTFIECFNGDAPIDKRTTDMIANDDLWSASDVISLKQQTR